MQNCINEIPLYFLLSHQSASSKSKVRLKWVIGADMLLLVGTSEIFWLVGNQWHEKRRWQTSLPDSQMGHLSPSLESRVHVVAGLRPLMKPWKHHLKNQRIQNFVTLFWNTAYITTDHSQLGEIAQCATIIKISVFFHSAVCLFFEVPVFIDSRVTGFAHTKKNN